MLLAAIVSICPPLSSWASQKNSEKKFFWPELQFKNFFFFLLFFPKNHSSVRIQKLKFWGSVFEWSPICLDYDTFFFFEIEPKKNFSGKIKKPIFFFLFQFLKSAIGKNCQKISLNFCCQLRKIAPKKFSEHFQIIISPNVQKVKIPLKQYFKYIITNIFCQ